MKSEESLPDVPDMVEAGMPLWAAFELWSKMMASNYRDPTYWWRRVTSWPASSSAVMRARLWLILL